MATMHACLASSTFGIRIAIFMVYGASDNAMQTHCNEYQLPMHLDEHWATTRRIMPKCRIQKKITLPLPPSSSLIQNIVNNSFKCIKTDARRPNWGENKADIQRKRNSSKSFSSTPFCHRFILRVSQKSIPRLTFIGTPYTVHKTHLDYLCFHVTYVQRINKKIWM